VSTLICIVLYDRGGMLIKIRTVMFSRTDASLQHRLLDTRNSDANAYILVVNTKHELILVVY